MSEDSCDGDPGSSRGGLAPLPAVFAEPEARGRLARIRERLGRLEAEVTSFWWPRAADREHGGFYGFLDRRGCPGEPGHKSIIQQARHLWALAAWAERRGRAPLIDDLARDTHRFIERAFLDRRDRQYVHLVSRSGALIDPAKSLYGQGFAIYGLCSYGRVYGLPAVTAAALACFAALDRERHDDRYGGYDETGDPEWVTGGAPKDTNTHLHLMEPFTALYDATGDPRVRVRLRELVEIVARRLLQPAGYVHQRFALDFSPLGPPRVSYGHDLETTWLLMDARRALGEPLAHVREAAIRMGCGAADGGYDAAQGGFFEEGVPGGAVLSRTKVWWAQFEALAGLLWLLRLTGDRRHLERLERTLDWIEGPARDPVYGEWYFEVAPDGTPGARGDHKGEIWKATYHQLRALLFVGDWIEQWLMEPVDGGERP